MATQLPPIPNNPITDTHVWRDWFFKVSQLLIQTVTAAWVNIDFTSSNIRDIQTRQHNALQDIQGGNGSTEYFHLSQAEYTTVQGIPVGLSVTITTAKVTSLGANGSMTFVNGILTAQTQAT